MSRIDKIRQTQLAAKGLFKSEKPELASSGNSELLAVESKLSTIRDYFEDDFKRYGKEWGSERIQRHLGARRDLAYAELYISKLIDS